MDPERAYTAQWKHSIAYSAQLCKSASTVTYLDALDMRVGTGFRSRQCTGALPPAQRVVGVLRHLLHTRWKFRTFKSLTRCPELVYLVPILLATVQEQLLSPDIGLRYLILA